MGKKLGTWVLCANNSEGPEAGVNITAVALIMNLLVIYGCSCCARNEPVAEAAATLSRDHQASDADYVFDKDHVKPLMYDWAKNVTDSANN